MRVRDKDIAVQAFYVSAILQGYGEGGGLVWSLIWSSAGGMFVARATGSLAHWVIVGSSLPLVGVGTDAKGSHCLACRAAWVYRSFPFSSMTASLTKEDKPRKQPENGLYRGQSVVLYELKHDVTSCRLCCILWVRSGQRQGKNDGHGHLKRWTWKTAALPSASTSGQSWGRNFLQKTMVAAKATEVLTA